MNRKESEQVINTLLWMYRRLKPGYGNLPFVDEAITLLQQAPSETVGPACMFVSPCEGTGERVLRVQEALYAQPAAPDAITQYYADRNRGGWTDVISNGGLDPRNAQPAASQEPCQHSRQNAVNHCLDCHADTTGTIHQRFSVGAQPAAQAVPANWQAQHLRQYLHNDGSGLVFGYDKDGIDKMLAALPAAPAAPAVPEIDSIPQEALRAANALLMDMIGKPEWDLPCAAKHIMRYAQPAAPQEPVAWMWQNEETGNIGFIDAWQLQNGWEKENPRLRIISPLYAKPAESALSTALELLAKVRPYIKPRRDNSPALIAVHEAIESEITQFLAAAAPKEQTT